MEKTISGAKAFERMRRLKLLPNAYFGLVFITCDLKRNRAGEVRKYEKCRIRPARKDEGISVSADHYLYFENVENGDAKQCFKKLIRSVAFPPDYEYLTVKWFE